MAHSNPACRCLWIAVLLWAKCSIGLAQSAFVLTNSGGVMQQRDPLTFDVLRSVESAPSYNNYGPICFDGDRIWSLGHMSGVPSLCATNPGDGSTVDVGSTALQLGFGLYAIESDPLSGEIWLSAGGDLYTLNKTNGSAAYVGYVSGLLPWDGVLTLAIESPSRAFSVGGLLLNPTRSALYEIDLTSLSANLVGMIQMPYLGRWQDVALLPDGDLLGTYRRLNSYTSAPLYRIDRHTAIATLVFRSEDVAMPDGIAAGFGTRMSTYCTGKTNSAGCVPTISALGFASATGTSGFTVTAQDVLNRSWGGLFWTTAGPAHVPFGGGTLCLASPVLRAPAMLAGGSVLPVVDCSGHWRIDMNAHLQALVPLPAGTALYCQWLGRDAGYATPQALQVSNALGFTLKP